jgi:hypothetical protein
MCQHQMRVDDAWTLRVEPNDDTILGVEPALSFTVQGDDAGASWHIYLFPGYQGGIAAYADRHDVPGGDRRQDGRGLGVRLNDHAMVLLEWLASAAR